VSCQTPEQAARWAGRAGPQRFLQAFAGLRSVPANGRIALRVPPDVIKAKIAPYRRRGKPWHRAGLQNLDDHDIVRTYGAEYRGIVNYYLLAQDVWRLGTLCWYAQTSMLKTLAAKHKSSVAKMAARYKAKAITGHGPRTCYEARRHRQGKKDLVAHFGGIPLGKTGAPSSMTPPRPGTAIPARN
jgi:hypothetical protein